MRQDCRTANANIISFYTYNACVPVDTFLSTVVSKTVPLLQNKQLNYKQNDIRLAKFRENIRRTLQKKRIARLTRTNADKFADGTAHRQDFCTFLQVSQRRRFLQQAQYPTRKINFLSACRCVEKTPEQNRVVTCVEFERFCKAGTFCKRLTVQAKFHMTKQKVQNVSIR